jgi:hypothetical protein
VRFQNTAIKSRAMLGLLVAVTFTSCKKHHAPMTNTIVKRADGQSSALLVERYYRAALSNDQFYLLILKKGRDAGQAINSENIADSSVLVATSAQKVQLRWQDKDTRLVICDGCGLEAIDISKKLDSMRSTKIVYQGFPKHTAYS